MCDTHEHHERSALNRRAFATMALGGGASLLLPRGARAAGAAIKAVCIMCIDYRLIDTSVEFFDAKFGKEQYDLVALAGASLASVSQMFPASVNALWNHITVAHTLHAIKDVVVVDHYECGAYKNEFGPQYTTEPGKELDQHKGVMARMRTEFGRRGYTAMELNLSFYFIPGKDEQPQYVRV